MIYYKLVKVTIYTSRLVKVITNIIICYYNILISIITDKNLLFISKFWFLLYYHLNSKRKLSITFYLQINSQIKKLNSIIKTYFRVIINF